MSSLPLYKQIIICVIFLCTTGACLLPLLEAMRQRRETAVPPVPQFPGSSFPNAFAYIYTAFFMLTFAMSAIQDIMAPAAVASPMEMLLSGVVQIGLYMHFIIVYFSLPRREQPQSSLILKVWWVVKALFFIWIASALIELSQVNRLISHLTQCPPLQNVVQLMMDGSSFEKIYIALMAVFIAPVTEECCFRGFVYNILKRWNGRWIATLSSALLFAAVHGSLLQLIPLTIFGVVQCLAYEKARSLWLPVAIHTVFNACSTLLILLFPELIPV